LENARNKANDPSLSEEERAQWRRKAVALEQQLSEGKGESKSISDHLKRLTERIKNNNKTISGIGTNTDEKHWIWDLFTLENIMIGVAMYVGYKLLKDDKK
jgi:predicted  nucleic acid-binding Zn-ribbon protein